MKLNTQELNNILRLFYNLSGIRIVVFDENFCEVISYPQKPCRFCREIKSLDALKKKCAESDNNAFKKCANDGNVYIYKCHAGLTEATIPLKDHNKIIGYMMFGQITDLRDRRELADFVANVNKMYNINCTEKGIKYRSCEQISAAAQLLEICTNYILLKEMVQPETGRITHLAKEYIKQHLTEEIKICDICVYADVSRTKLYDTFKADCGMGVSAYIRKKRLEYAKALLKTGDFSVSDAAQRSGFSDYNYFSRIFKKQYKVSPHKIRQS